MPPGPQKPSALTHLELAFGHLLYADALATRKLGDDPVIVGWAITGLFYSSLHVVRAYLTARHGFEVREHRDMDEVWRRFPEVAKIRRTYDLLKQESQTARYYGGPHFTWNDFSRLRQTALSINAPWTMKTRPHL